MRRVFGAILGCLGQLALGLVALAGIVLMVYVVVGVLVWITGPSDGEGRREAWEECIRDDMRDPETCGDPPA